MVLPPSMQSSLPAGWLTFTGRVLNPLDRYKRFQIIHPPFLDFAWRKGSIMDWQGWRKALELYLNTPELIVASILVAIAIFGFAWWLHSHISKERIAALQDRLRLGKQVQEHITNELDSLKQTVSRQEAILNDLRSTGGVPRTQVELLSSANAAVVSSLADLEQANTNLGFTLTLAGAGVWLISRL